MTWARTSTVEKPGGFAFLWADPSLRNIPAPLATSCTLAPGNHRAETGRCHIRRSEISLSGAAGRSVP